MVCSYTVALVGRKGFSWVLRKKQNMQIFSFNFEACKFSLNLTATGSKTQSTWQTEVEARGTCRKFKWGCSTGVLVETSYWSESKRMPISRKVRSFFRKFLKTAFLQNVAFFHISKRPDLDEQKEVYAPIKWPQLRLESLRMIVTVPREQLIWQSMSSIWYAIKYPMKLKFPLIEKKKRNLLRARI